MKNILWLTTLIILAGCSVDPHITDDQPVAQPSEDALQARQALDVILSTAKRIPNTSGWFEVLRLPNNVYAFWEPGHVEKVNSFLIVGKDRDVLYDTGMGIANIRTAIDEVRRAESLPSHPLMVVNSHNHLDHNGGNKEFEQIWTVNEPWAITRLTTGVPAGEAGGFVSYWDQLTPHQGVEPPSDFSPLEHGIPPYPEDQIGFLKEAQMLDLGDRTLQVIRTFSHSPDGIALFSKDAGLFFGGDTFYGSNFLVTDIGLLADDLRRIENLPIRWHYASHGAQLITAMQQGRQLAAVQRMISGEGEHGQTSFAGFDLPIQSLDGVSVTVAKELLLY